ncbi:hypothetical protein QRQ56_30885 [Bradyrhizobium sp. U531]|uniref:hypothetical protein n=1 Tax=Bradyrhizobium sp. U531 TaxID=3053458 RepID=UPI003F437C0A
MTDNEMCLDALRLARMELSRYINPLDPFDSVQALDRLIELLDSDQLDAALARIDARNHFSVMDFRYVEKVC